MSIFSTDSSISNEVQIHIEKWKKVKLLSRVWLFAPHNCSLPSSSIHGLSQARILEWVAISFSRGSSQSRDWTQASCIAGGFFTSWATWRGIIICRQTGLSETSLSRSEKNLCITVCLLTQHFIIFSYNILLLSTKNSLQTSWFSLRACPTYAQDNKA